MRELPIKLVEQLVTREISVNGYKDFASRHESTQCANFYGIPLLEQAQLFSSYDVYDNESGATVLQHHCSQHLLK